MVIGSSSFFTDHTPHLGHLYHWGKWVLARGMKSAVLSESDLKTLCLTIRSKALHRETIRPHGASRVNYKRRMAMTLRKSHVSAWPDRKSIAKALSLKKKSSMNSDVNRNLYRALVECSQEQLEKAIQLYVDIASDVERNGMLSELFNIDRFQRSDRQTYELVRAAYPAVENPRNEGRNRGSTGHRHNRYSRGNNQSNRQSSQRHHRRGR